MLPGHLCNSSDLVIDCQHPKARLQLAFAHLALVAFCRQKAVLARLQNTLQYGSRQEPAKRMIVCSALSPALSKKQIARHAVCKEDHSAARLENFLPRAQSRTPAPLSASKQSTSPQIGKLRCKSLCPDNLTWFPAFLSNLMEREN